MIGEEIFQNLDELYRKDRISKQELVSILKEYGKLVSVYDLMMSASLFRNGMEYVQEKYHDQFAQPYIKSFILGFNELMNCSDEINGYIDHDLFKCCFDNLKYNFYKDVDDDRRKYKFPLIMTLSSFYVTFISKQPLHPVGSVFPGQLEVYEEDGIFYCPVKDAQKDNPDALCCFCVAEQTPNLNY